MLGGSASASRSRLGFSRGRDSSGTERAILGFSRGATRGSLGVVKSLYANAAHPRLGTTSSDSGPSERTQRRDPMERKPKSKGGGCSTVGGTCSIPMRDRSNRREAIAEHHRQEDSMFPKPGGVKSGGGGSNRGEGGRGGMYQRKGMNLPDFLRRDYSKYSGGGSRSEEPTYEEPPSSRPAADRFGGRRFGGPSSSSRGYSAPEPEPEVYTFGPPTVQVKSSRSYDDSPSPPRPPKQVRFEDEVDVAEVRRPAVVFENEPAYEDAGEVEEDLAALDRLAPRDDYPGSSCEEPREVPSSSSPPPHRGSSRPSSEDASQTATALEQKWDSLLGMLDERFSSLSSRSQDLEKVVEQLAKMQMVQMEAKPEAAPQPKDSFYGKVGRSKLPFFVTLPEADVPEDTFEEACDCLAAKGDWIQLTDPVPHPVTQASWYEARHIDPQTGIRSTFWAPAAMEDKQCFERFAAYPC